MFKISCSVALKSVRFRIKEVGGDFFGTFILKYALRDQTFTCSCSIDMLSTNVSRGVFVALGVSFAWPPHIL